MWRALYLSFYSKDFYRDVAQNWRGLALSYLLLLVVLYCIPLTLTANAAFRLFVDTKGQELIDKMPVITFKDGTLSIPNKQPYLIYMGDTYENGKSKEFIIFDNTGKYKIDNLYPGQILVTERFLHVREESGKITPVPFDKFPNDMIGHDELRDFAHGTKRWFMPVFFISASILFYIARIIQVLFYGLLGLFLNKIMRAFLEYPQLVRLSAAALTPVLVIDTVLLLLAPGHPLSGLIGFVVAMGYLIFGIRANRELIT